jgi:hypothetical protein
MSDLTSEPLSCAKCGESKEDCKCDPFDFVKARFSNGQDVKFPLGDGTYQLCKFIGIDCYGLSTVKTKGGRYKKVWDCNLYQVINQ